MLKFNVIPPEVGTVEFAETTLNELHTSDSPRGETFTADPEVFYKVGVNEGILLAANIPGDDRKHTKAVEIAHELVNERTDDNQYQKFIQGVLEGTFTEDTSREYAGVQS